MRYLIAVYIGFLLSFSAQAETGYIKVNIVDIKEKTGLLKVTVYDDEKGWLKEPFFRKVDSEVDTEGDIQVLVEDVPPGTYAIVVFQDVNADGNIEKNFLGIPKEPYGFSAPMGKFGPPKYKDASFEVTTDGVEVSVTLN